MGDPYHLKRAELKRHRVAVFSSNYTLYGDMSRRVMQTLSAFTPELEIYSIDEAFLNLAGFEHRDLTEYARTIRAEVKQATGIPVALLRHFPLSLCVNSRPEPARCPEQRRQNTLSSSARGRTSSARP
jgi:nucleotidyltransferase/DNA polymerase involved in DNA repair